MLAKLIKLDLRFAYKKFLIMAALLLIFGLVMPYVGEGILRTGVAVIFGAVMTVVPLMCVWLVVQHFQRNLFSSEGYLMFTLPVKAGELLLSKLITTVIWFNLMLASAGALLVLLVREQMPLSAILPQLDWGTINQILCVVARINFTVIPMILAIFMGIACSTVAVNNRKVGLIPGIVVMLLGIAPFAWTMSQLSSWIFIGLSAANGSMLASGLSAESPWITAAINAAVAAGFSALYFLITTHVMQRRLNLE